MNVDILKRLTNEQLFELKAATEKEIGSRFDYSILPGRTGWFISSQDGSRVEVRVEKINPKSVSVVEIANIKKRWKVSPELLNIDGILRSPEKRPTPSPKPSESYNQTAW